MVKNLIKDKLGILKLEKENNDLKNQVEHYRMFVENKIAELKNYTRVDADIGFRGNNTIVLTGVYNRRGYVHFYDVGDGEFVYLVELLKNMKKHALIRNLDCPPNFKGIFDL